MHTPQSLADVLERDYFPMPSGSTKPSAKRYGAKLYLTEHEWRMVIAALRASPPEAEQRDKILAEAVDEIRKEYLVEKTGTEEDEAYDAAVAHCIGAVIAMMSSPDRSPHEGEKP
jgi:hypothetical protein